MMASSRSCQGINARVREQAHACGAPSSEADPVRGRSGPSSEAESARGKHTPSNGTKPTRGRRASSSEAKPARGDLRVDRLGGPLGASAAWVMSCMVRRGVFSFVACFKRGFPSCLRGPLVLSPTPSATNPRVVGGAGIQLREDAAEQYLTYKLVDSNTDWKTRWFYITNHHPGLRKPSG
jgi:hypothetical protein